MNTDRARLSRILTYKRPHGSKGVDAFIKDVLSGYEFETLRAPSGEPLALVLRVGTSKTLFSAHLDTVHHSTGRQVVAWDEGISLYYTIDGATECLGADDGAGLWLLLNMIDAAVQGVYVLHYGEEAGGVGSSGIATHHADFLGQFDRAIAFDRKGRDNVITHQAWGRCCSDEFAEALAASLNEVDTTFTYAPDNTGLFTDTANYVDLIPECTNISVGYDSEHTSMETLDFEHLAALRVACLNVDWESLPTHRLLGEDEKALNRFDMWAESVDETIEGLAAMKYRDLEAWVEENLDEPWVIAEMLYEALGR